MSQVAGQLLWNRVRVAIAPSGIQATPTPVNTGLRQVSQAFGNDPGLAARTMVIPEVGSMYFPAWQNYITHGEPYMQNGTVWVDFYNTNVMNSYTIRVLFWAPHTLVSPGSVEDYDNTIPQPTPP